MPTPAVGGGKNLASKYSKVIDERFTRESQAMLALSNNYDFTGVQTVNVYSIPVVPLTDYQRSGLQRYGVPDDLQRNVQSMTVTKDRAFTFIIDKGDKLQSEMVMDAGKAIQRNLKEVWIPEFDTYVFKTLADAAISNGAYSVTPATNQNAYELFLAGMERLGNANVPDQGRVAFCSYGFANLLKRDPAFMRNGDQSQQMLIKGVIGEVDGCKIVKVPSSRLPAGAACIITHPVAATAPKQLEEYKIHDNPPGISGWLCEGRFIYDCFILNEKIDAVYYIGGQNSLIQMHVITAAGGGTTKAQVVFEPGQLDSKGAKWYAMSATSASGLTALTKDSSGAYQAITTSGWTELSGSGAVYTAGAATHKVIRVVEVDSNNVPIAVGDAVLNLG